MSERSVVVGTVQPAGRRVDGRGSRCFSQSPVPHRIVREHGRRVTCPASAVHRSVERHVGAGQHGIAVQRDGTVVRLVARGGDRAAAQDNALGRQVERIECRGNQPVDRVLAVIAVNRQVDGVNGLDVEQVSAGAPLNRIEPRELKGATAAGVIRAGVERPGCVRINAGQGAAIADDFEHTGKTARHRILGALRSILVNES